MTTTRLLAALLLALPLTACKGPERASATGEAKPAAAGATATTAAPARAAKTAADDNLNAVLWIQTSAEYEAAARQTYHSAAQLLDRAIKEDWQALVPEERAKGGAKLPPAVILDIDETVLDNSPYQARLIADGTEYDEVTWDAWVAEKKARALPGVVDFAKAAQAKGVTLLYLSNRAEHLQAATLANLRAVGMPVKDDSVFLGLGTFVEGCEQHGSEKTCRRQLAARQYRVVMQFGDQLGDFVQILSNTPADRTKLLAEHRDWFGERWWMLPNPTYGSWEPAVFNNDFSKPREERRALKKDALRDER